MKWLWVGGAALFAVAAGAVWMRFGDPTWVSGLIIASVGSIGVWIWDRLAPSLIKAFRASPETVEANKRRVSRGEQPRMGRDIPKSTRGAKEKS